MSEPTPCLYKKSEETLESGVFFKSLQLEVMKFLCPKIREEID